MSFASNDSINKKQHLNLSSFAYDVIQADIFAFGESTLSGFINRIFECYHAEASASISRSINELKGEMEKLMAEVAGDERTKQKVTHKILQAKTSTLLRQSQSYENGLGFKFSLNEKNFRYLSDDYSECEEEQYYARRGEYIKSVIEEYARLPFVTRERVYYSAYVDEIHYALQKGCQLRVTTEKNGVYSVYPYKILTDPLSIANYLLGYCKRYDTPDEEKRPCSFRISALQAIKAEKSKSSFLKLSEREALLKTIHLRGVQFMIGDEAEIYVKLTDRGVERYHRQVHLRPLLIRKEGDIYVFQCTTAQAEFYFFKFGEDAEILFPTQLRDKFKAMYEAAAHVYSV